MPDPVPPKFVSIPAGLMYSKDTPAVVKETYGQLRGLVQKGEKDTPPYTFKELAEIFGKSPSIVYEHVRLLRLQNWITFSDAGGARYTFSFSDQPELPGFSSLSENHDVALINSSIKSNSVRGLINTSYENHENDDKKRDPLLDNPAVIMYRGIARITANPVQRENIAKSVTDLVLWKATLEHWMGHGWSKMNVSGMLSSYSKGGQAGCRMCNPQPVAYGRHADPPTPVPTEAERADKAAKTRAIIEAAKAKRAAEIAAQGAPQ